MDYNGIIALALSFLLGISAVSHFIGGIMPKLTKWITVAHRALALLDDIVLSLKDGKITAEEIPQLEKDIASIREALSA